MAALAVEYGVEPVSVERVHAGTATDNFVVSTSSGPQWFAKVYRAHADLRAERAAIELANFARSSGCPVPDVLPTREGDLIGTSNGVTASLWDFVGDSETAEGGLSGARWGTVGAITGHLHRHLARHPAAIPSRRRATGLADVEAATAEYDRLISQYLERTISDPFEVWALEAAMERRALLPRAGRLLESLPALGTQVVHGDLAAPNLLLRGDDVAAIIDFQPPGAHYLSWEIARIACDPRTVVSTEAWPEGLATFLEAYRGANPTVKQVDLDSAIALGCAATLLSTYPLAEPIRRPQGVDDTLRAYGRARHHAALRIFDHLGL